MSIVFAQKWNSYVLDSMTDISYYNTNASLCSNLATMVLKIVHYMNVVSCRIKIWSLPLTYAWRKSFVVITDVCQHVIFFFLTQLFTLSAKQDVNRKHSTNKEGIFRWKYLMYMPIFPHQANRKVWWTSVLQQHFPFQANKNTNTNRTTL